MLSIASNFNTFRYRTRIRIVGVVINFDALSLLSITSTERHYTLEATKAC